MLSNEGVSMEKMSLEAQCAELSLPLEEIQLEYDGRPEPALLKHFENLGYVGSFIEGYTFLTVLKALMLDKLVELNTINDRHDACTRYLEAQFTIHRDKLDEIINSIRCTSKEKYLSNLRAICTQPFIQRKYPSLSFECCEALFNAIDKEIFIAAAKKFSEDPYSYRSGWPDLIIVKGCEVRFVEVKTTDKLHKSQLLTIPTFQKILPYDFSVCRIRK